MTPILSGPYAGLQAYLKGRYADNLVLTFDQIEDLMGSPLPPVASHDAAWWDNGEGATPTPQSSAWRQSHRTATVNLSARTVLFQRDI